MPRRLPFHRRSPQRRPAAHPFLPPSLASVKSSGPRSIVRRPSNDLQSTSSRKGPPKILALETAPRIPLSPDLTQYERRLARIEQIKKLYTPKEFKRLMDEKMQLVLPESPLKTVSGRVRISIVFWVYLSLMVSAWQFSEYLYTKKEPEGIPWDFWKNWREWMPKGLLYDPEDADLDPIAFAQSLDGDDEEDGEEGSEEEKGKDT